VNFPFYIAKRYLISKKSHNAINIISWVSVISVGIGTFALVVVLSAFNGLESLVESLFESFDSDIRIEAKEGKVFDSKTIDYEKLTSLEGVENYSRVLEEVCGIRYQKQQTVATIKGVEPAFMQMSELDSMMIEGNTQLVRNGIPFAISGYGIASALGLYMSKAPDNLTIYAPKRGRVSTINPMQSVYQNLIAAGGTFYISPEYDNKYIVVPLNFAQELLDYENEVTSIEVKAKDDYDLEKVEADIEALLGDKFEVTNRYQFNEIIYKTNRTEKWVTFLILVFILIIAAFNILSSLSMLIIEKKKDIYTLKSLGAKNSSIRNIFFVEGLLINLSGAIVGLGLGVILVLLQEHVGLIRLEGGIVEYYPVELKISELFYILLTVLIIGFLTAWYPVRNLTRVE
jgi:lipoprotein-releasing system permease protein